ncbi:TPA: hypothetical protein N0F65_001700 [Lagenidium giganteum]|uniref:Phospholipid:diacylglycerol acyltransferase n=1 Tax=Lagenidium giganteum TaxID=4803 RepID=A0AAV2YP43_9STRA|nr:TPA: hypothetical protein N0F65_001700 [Lagenidium giganteum]
MAATAGAHGTAGHGKTKGRNNNNDNGGGGTATRRRKSKAHQQRNHMKQDPTPKPSFENNELTHGGHSAPPKARWDGVVHKRRYYVLIGVFLGIASVALSHFVYNSDQSIEDMITLPADSMKILREKFRVEWSKVVKHELLASIDYRPLIESADRPGMQLHQEKLQAYSPVVMIPGFTSTGLEIWNGSDCSKSYFRQRMWGTARMLQQFMLNQKCWLEHVMLNRSTGMDPEGIKLRPAYGLEAADYVIGGYWVWGKIIENLADIGYDSNNMFMASYDWRLAPMLLEQRDRYFTKLKYTIEMAKLTNDDRKVVVMAHSFGAQVWFYFMKWVESEHGGNAGPNWVDNHIEGFINIAGSTLGSMKAMSALLSGEMKDTAELGGLSKFLEYFFAPSSRASLARSWASVSTLMPIGGEAIWGNETYAPDDIVSRFAVPPEGSTDVVDESQIADHIEKHGSNGAILQFLNESQSNLTASTIREFLSEMDHYLKNVNSMFTSEIAADPSLPKYDRPEFWTNPLASALPKAANTKIFCLYGVGKPVERGYVYRTNPTAAEVKMDDNKPVVPYLLNTDYHDLPWVKAGIRYTEGDGTVPLMSLGFMCARGWREPRYNPSGMEVRIREYYHKPVAVIYDPRGGPATSDHVDIMGNHEMITDILRIAARTYDDVPEQVVSKIHDVAERVDLSPRA